MSTRRGVFWPLLLIALGVVFLLANYGFIGGVSWVAILNLWPLLLILIGLDIAFSRRWPVPTLLAEILVIAAGLAFAATPAFGGPILSIGPSEPGQTDVTAPRGTATRASVRIGAGAGTVHVTGGASDLVDAHSTNPDLRMRVAGSADHPDIRLDQVSSQGFGVFHANGTTDIQIELAGDVPTELDLDVGAGDFDVDLSNVRVTGARLNAGASMLRLALPKPSGDVAFRVNGGASNVVVTVPDGVEVKVSTTGGLLSVRSDNPRLSVGTRATGCFACGTSVQSSGYDSATDRITLTISAGASSIVVR